MRMGKDQVFERGRISQGAKEFGHGVVGTDSSSRALQYPWGLTQDPTFSGAANAYLVCPDTATGAGGYDRAAVSLSLKRAWGRTAASPSVNSVRAGER